MRKPLSFILGLIGRDSIKPPERKYLGICCPTYASERFEAMTSQEFINQFGYRWRSEMPAEDAKGYCVYCNNGGEPLWYTEDDFNLMMYVVKE